MLEFEYGVTNDWVSVFYSGTVHIYTISRYLMSFGYSCKVRLYKMHHDNFELCGAVGWVVLIALLVKFKYTLENDCPHFIPVNIFLLCLSLSGFPHLHLFS